MILTESFEPFSQIWYFITNTFIEQGLEHSDETGAYEHIGETDLIVDDPFHEISFLLVLQMRI